MDQQHAAALVANFYTSFGDSPRRWPMSLWRCAHCRLHPFQVRDHMNHIVRFYPEAYGQQIAMLATEVIDAYVKLPRAA